MLFIVYEVSIAKQNKSASETDLIESLNLFVIVAMRVTDNYITDNRSRNNMEENTLFHTQLNLHIVNIFESFGW